MTENFEGMRIAITILSVVLALGVVVFIVWAVRVWMDTPAPAKREKKKPPTTKED